MDVADDLRQLVEKFYFDNPEILNEVFSTPKYDEQNIKHFAEIVNPGGNRSYKKGLYFLMMYENRVVDKKFGTDPQDLTWWDFWQITRDIFGKAAAGPKTWQSYFGGNEDGETEQGDKESDPESGSNAGDGNDHIQQTQDNSGERQEGTAGQSSEPEGSGEPEDDGGAAEAEDDTAGEESGEGDCEETAGGQTAEPGETESQGEEIAPAQKSGENQEILKEEAVLEELEIDMNPPEIVEKGVTRKEYLDTLTSHGMAQEVVRMIRSMDDITELTDEHFWEHWLERTVDYLGRDLEEEE